MDAFVKAGYTEKEAIDLFLTGDYGCNACQLQERLEDGSRLFVNGGEKEIKAALLEVLDGDQRILRIVVAHAVKAAGYSDGRFGPMVVNWSKNIVGDEDFLYVLPTHPFFLDKLAMSLIIEDDLY